MKLFEEWLQISPLAPPPKGSWQDWEDQGHGLLHDSGDFMITCCCCDRDFAISDYIGSDEFDPDVSETFYCGGSERCCP